MSKACSDVTDEYKNNSTPGIGTKEYEVGYVKERHSEEIKMADWLHQKFGGDIILLKENSNEYWRMTADYNWKGRLWELKTVGSVKAVDKALRKAINQIKPNPGGVIIDFGTKSVTPANAESLIQERINTSANFSLDVLLLHNGELFKAFRFK